MIQSVAAQFNAGGAFMWVILAAFTVGFAVMLERIFYFFVYCSGDSLKPAQKILYHLQKGEAQEALKVANRRKTPLHRLLQSAIAKYVSGASVEKITESVEQSAIRELPRLSKRINYLSLVANVATLLGLLGTITGLQVSFGSLANVDAAQKASMLANGIAQAMNTTAFGLIVAVPCMVMYTVLSNKQQELVRVADESISQVVTTIKEMRA